MKILSFDTTNSLASTCIIIDGTIVSYNTTTQNSQQAEKLFLLIDETLKQAQLSINKIDLISVTNGPGSFTGVRIGLAAALGIKSAINKEIIGLSNFQILAYHARLMANNSNISVLLDARRNQLYTQDFDYNISPLNEPQLIQVSELKINNNSYYVGDGVKLVTSSLQNQDISANAKLSALATEFLYKNKLYYDLIPLYIRQPDVTVRNE